MSVIFLRSALVCGVVIQARMAFAHRDNQDKDDNAKQLMHDTNEKCEGGNNQTARGLPGLDLAQQALEAMEDTTRLAIVGYASLNNGHCPVEVWSPGVDDAWVYGTGCGFQKEELCHCQYSPFFTCATHGLLWDPEGLTALFINTFGYCRLAIWIVAAPVAFLFLLIAFCVCRKKSSHS